MQFFYVKKDVQLRLAHKTKKLLAVSNLNQSNGLISFDRTYCGFIAWEYLTASQMLGPENVIYLGEDVVTPSLLPFKIRPFNIAGDIRTQIETILSNVPNDITPCLKIAIINGTGTMLGDTLVGSSVLEYLYKNLKNIGFHIVFDVYCAWNSRIGVEGIWKKTDGISRVFSSSPTVSELQQYDAFYDFSLLLKLDGYSSEHFADFYFNSFGLNPLLINSNLKVPIIKIEARDFNDTRKTLQLMDNPTPLVLIAPDSSTNARTMPDSFLRKLIKQLIKSFGIKIILCTPNPKGLSNFERAHIVNLNNFTLGNLDRFLSVIAQSDYVISVDTLALHVAIGCKKPGIALFTLSDPQLRLKYSPQIDGLLLPGAQNLAYWGKHKSDDNWDKHSESYKKAWNEISLDPILLHLARYMNLSKGESYIYDSSN